MDLVPAKWDNDDTCDGGHVDRCAVQSAVHFVRHPDGCDSFADCPIRMCKIAID